MKTTNLREFSAEPETKQVLNSSSSTFSGGWQPACKCITAFPTRSVDITMERGALRQA
ncbi:hypothetical protein P3375_26075 [Vibrio parahaemolyticus]|nr:hypothetical protein [Vibrio parahaemolyticus]